MVHGALNEVPLRALVKARWVSNGSGINLDGFNAKELKSGLAEAQAGMGG